MYAAVDNLKSYLDISGTTEDVLLAQIIARAQHTLETQTGKVFEATADSTKTYDAITDVDGNTLTVDWLCSITSITNGDSAVLAATDYVTQPRNTAPYYAIRLLASSGLAWTYDDDHENAITIVGKFAYTDQNTGAVWGPASDACLELAMHLYRLRANAGDLDRPLIVGNTTILPAQWPQNVRMFIESVRSLH